MQRLAQTVALAPGPHQQFIEGGVLAASLKDVEGGRML